MPYMSITTGVALPPDKREAISQEMAQLITVIPGKNVNNLMLSFHGEIPMVLGGREEAQFLFMELRLYGTAEKEAQKKIILGSYEIFGRILGIPQENIYITITEHAVFGARGAALGL